MSEDLTRDEVAKILKVTPRTIYNYVHRGQLKAYELDNGGMRIKPEWLDEFRERRRVKPTKAAA